MEDILTSNNKHAWKSWCFFIVSYLLPPPWFIWGPTTAGIWIPLLLFRIPNCGLESGKVLWNLRIADDGWFCELLALLLLLFKTGDGEGPGWDEHEEFVVCCGDKDGVLLPLLPLEVISVEAELITLHIGLEMNISLLRPFWFQFLVQKVFFFVFVCVVV